MNVYDFDHTIYNGDSTIDFYLFMLRKHPGLIRYIPRQMIYFLKYKLKQCDKAVFKEQFYSFLKGIKNIENEVDRFWNTHAGRIAPWYLEQKREDDIIISASPSFLLEPMKQYLSIQDIIASEVDEKCGKLLGKNCYGEEKVVRFCEEYGEHEVEEFYSDSFSDEPMARLAQRSFIVKKGERVSWEK